MEAAQGRLDQRFQALEEVPQPEAEAASLEAVVLALAAQKAVLESVRVVAPLAMVLAALLGVEQEVFLALGPPATST